jgi:hypothetical protein
MIVPGRRRPAGQIRPIRLRSVLGVVLLAGLGAPGGTLRAQPTAAPALVAPAAPLAPRRGDAVRRAADDWLAARRPARDTLPRDTIPRDSTPLSLTLDARLESKTIRARNERCTASQLTQLGANCRGFFQPQFDFQVNVKSAGTIADRLGVNVDYDSQREFDASNLISVAYQGKPNARLSRVEVGNVSFAAPSSRFLTAGIPSGNYGVQAQGRLGGMRLRAIAAQQRGNVSRDNVFVVGDRTLRPESRTIDDIQVEPRRFFFTVDPRQLPGWPNIDLLDRLALQRAAASLPDTVRPARIYLYRQLIGAANQNPRGPQFIARGARNPTRQIYELLRENVDYYLDPSQLWFALVRPLALNNERLVVAYEVSLNGQLVRFPSTGGTPDLEFTEAPQFANLVWEPELAPTDAPFVREIRNAYRIGGEDVRRESVQIRIVSGVGGGDQERPADPSRGNSYLQLFGVAQATNSAQFDVENRLWPRPQDPNVNPTGGANAKLIRDYFMIFPSLRPFAREGLAQPRANPSNDTLYTFPNEFLYSTQRPQAVYRMQVSYQHDAGADVGSLTLNTVQVRPFSERVLLEGALLVRDRDYRADYELGRITFLRPDTLFPVPRQVTVRYEENPLFVAAPVTIFGVASDVPFENGALTFTAMSQDQRTVFTRPPLGYEPVGSLVAGATANFAWDAPLLTRALERLPLVGGRGTLGAARIGLTSEFAMSRPRPNRAGQAFLESFEGDAGVNVSLIDGGWYLSSVPPVGTVLGGVAGAGTLALPRAASLAWQNNGVTNGRQPLVYRFDEIDPAARFTGAGLQPPEQLLWMTLYPLRAGGLATRDDAGRRALQWSVGPTTSLGATPSGRRWRSIRTVLSPAGSDLSRIETLEFWTLVRNEPGRLRRNPVLVFDFGELSENSVAFVPESLTIARNGERVDSTYAGKRLIGYDRADSERDAFSRAFNAESNDTGLPSDRVDTLLVVDRAGGGGRRRETGVTLCSGASLQLQLLGDTRAACTVRNTRLDEEDIDLDGQLNFTAAQVDRERFRRFVVDLGDRRQWTRVGRCTTRSDTTIAGTVETGEQCWVQVRLNWRAPTDSQGTASDRRVRALRLTVISGAEARDDEFTQLPIGRIRLAGAPWLKRSERPLAGIAGDSLEGRPGYVVASLIGTQDSTATLVYQSPPGVGDQAAQRQTSLENTRVQINERALRLQAGVLGGQFGLYDRAEAFFRFPEGVKNFMGYRTLRLWARGRGNGWGPSGELDVFVRIGRDEHNFYLFRTRANAGNTASAWEPELRIDLARFFRLRAQLQNAWLQQTGDSLSCTGADLELIRRSAVPRGQFVQRFAACRDGYMVYTTDPAATPPNLAGVQELAVGFVRTDTIARSATGILPNDTLELWVNDVRLSDVVDDLGFAGEVGLSIQGGTLFDLRVGVSRRDPNFRQLAESPTFLTQDGIDVAATVRLDRFLPRGWGIQMPLSMHWSGASTAPEFLDRTDIQAIGLLGLRRPRASGAQYALSIRRSPTTPTTSLVDAVTRALALTATWGNGVTQTAFQRGRRSDYLVRADWTLPGSHLGGAVLDTASGDPFAGIAPIGGVASDSGGVLPEWADDLLGRLPRVVRESAAIRGLRTTRFAWRPQQFRFSSQIGRASNRNTSFLAPAASRLDMGRDVFGVDHSWRSTGVIEFRPAGALTARMDMDQAMDLRDYRGVEVPVALASPVDRGDVAWQERVRLLGLDVGLPRDRAVRSLLSFAPALTSWLTPRLDFTTSATVFRDPNGRSLLRVADTAGAYRLPRRVGGSRSLTLGALFDPARLIGGGPTDAARRRVGRIFTPIDLSLTRTFNANFDATPFDPGVGLQFGFAGLETYRQLDRRFAAQSGDTRRLAATTSLMLPLSLQVTGRVEQIDTDQWNRRVLANAQSLVQGQQRVIPDVTVRWSWRSTGDGPLLRALGWNARWLLTRQTFASPTEAGGLADASNSRVRSLPISGSLTWGRWLGGVTTNGSVNLARRRDERPGSVVAADSRDVSLDISRSFPLPGSWNFRSPLRTRVAWQESATESVVEGLGLGVGSRSVLANTGRRVFNLNADADVGEQLTLSLTASQILNLDRAFNRRLSQTVLSAVLNLQFFSGPMR